MTHPAWKRSINDLYKLQETELVFFYLSVLYSLYPNLSPILPFPTSIYKLYMCVTRLLLKADNFDILSVTRLHVFYT